MEVILKNLKYIQTHIRNTFSIKIYKNGVVGIDCDNNLVYIDLYTHSIQKILNLSSQKMFMSPIFIDNVNNNCFIMCVKKIILIDMDHKHIVSEKIIDFGAQHFTYYKDNQFIGFKKNNICLYNYSTNKLITLINTNDKINYLCKMINPKKGTFEYISNKKLYVYNIQSNTINLKQTEYVDVDTYKIVELKNDIHVCTTQAHSCICIYGVNKEKTKCIMGHFSPSFNNIEKVFKNIITTLGEEYKNIDIHMVGGFENNTSFLKMLDVFEDKYTLFLKEKIFNHISKPYNVIISKQGTIIH